MIVINDNDNNINSNEHKTDNDDIDMIPIVASITTVKLKILRAYVLT